MMLFSSVNYLIQLVLEMSVLSRKYTSSFQARCSVIATANPIGWRYSAGLTFIENDEFTEPIPQCFTILCVLEDNVDPLEDTHLVDFVISSHNNSIPINQKVQNIERNESAIMTWQMHHK